MSRKNKKGDEMFKDSAKLQKSLVNLLLNKNINKKFKKYEVSCRFILRIYYKCCTNMKSIFYRIL